MFIILMRNETILIIPKLQWNPNFFNLQEKRRLVQKIRWFKISREKLQCSTGDKEMTFGLSYQEVRKMRV